MKTRSRHIEPLEARIAPSIWYVGTPASFTDPAHPGSPVSGDSVTWNAGAGSHLSPSSVGGLTFGTNAFSTISAAVAAASNGDTIEVSTGVFTDNITINKSLTLLGANSGFAGSDGVNRTAETIIEPITNQNSIVAIASSGITIDGFTIDGDNPSVTGGSLASGHDANANYGLVATSGFSNLTIENEIVQHVAIGFRGTGLGSSNLITNNWFNDLGVFDFGYAVSLQNNFYADVTNNLMTKVWTGIQTSNFYAAGPASWNFTGNTIQSYAGGIWANLIYQAATPLTIDHNQISATTGAVTGNMGLLITTIQDAAVVTVTNNQISGTDYGVLAWNVPTTSTITLDSTNTISSTHVAGVDFTDHLTGTAIGTTVFGTGAASTLALNGLSIGTSAGTGLIVDATGATAMTLTLSGSIGISGGATGLELSGSLATITGNSLGSMTFTGQSGPYILLANGALHGTTLDATGVTFDGHTGATATLAQNFAIEDKITHAVDDATLGFVRVDAGNLFVTTNSFNSPDTTSASVQRAINLASPGDTVNIAAGNYTDNLTLNGPLTIVGAGDGTNPATSTIITAAVTTSPVVTVNGGGTDATHRLSLEELTLTGTTASGNSGSGVLVQNGASYLTFDHLNAEGLGGNGITFNQNATSTDVAVTNSTLSGNTGDGMRLATTAGINGLTITNSNLDNDAYGFESYAAIGSLNPLTNVNISFTSFSNDTFKGFYAEKLDHATLDHLTITNSGTGAASPAGIDINLKYASYSTIAITNTTITNSGTGSAGGIGLAIKGRNDAPTYNTNPASLSGVTLTDDTISGSPTDLSIGNNVTGLLLSGLILDGTGLGLTYYQLPAESLSVADTSFTSTLTTYIANQTANPIDATGATFGGIAASSATVAQQFAIVDKIDDGIDVPGIGLVRTNATNLYVTTNSFLSPFTSTASIQRAINLANPGDTINIAAGNYSDNLTLNGPLTIVGAGDGTNPATSTIITAAVTTSPVVTVNGGGTDATHRLSLEELTLTGTTASGNSGSGVLVQNGASYLTFDHLNAEGLGGNAITFNQNATSTDVAVTNSTLSGNTGDGMRLATTAGINGLTITNSHLDNDAYGFESYAAIGSPNPLTNVNISFTSFSNDTFKGFYSEKLDHATLDHLTVTNSGTGAASPAGIDINLKYSSYSTIAITNTTITNSGTGSAGGIGLAIKGRNDAPSYNTNPASLSGVTLTDDTIDGSPTDLSIGNNVTGLLFSGLILDGTGLGLTYYQLPAESLSVADTSFTSTLTTYIQNQTANPIDATGATFGGIAASSATVTQQFAIVDKIIDAIDVPGLGLVRTNATNLYVTPNSFLSPFTSTASIQRAINLANPGDTINVEAGSYPEAVNIDLAATVSLAGNVTIHSLTGLGTSEVQLNASTLTVGDSTSTTYPGLIAGTGGNLTKVGSGTLTLTDANTYTGVTTISAGAILAENNSALGATGSSSGTVVASGASLQLEGGISLGETLSLSGAGLGGSTGAIESISGSNSLSGPITLTGDTTILVDSSSSLAVSGSVDGPFDLAVSIGSGSVAGFSGGVGAHTAPTALTVTGTGTLDLAGTVSVAGDTTVNTRTILTGDTNVFSVGALKFTGFATIDGDGHGPWDLTMTTLDTMLVAAAVGQIAPLSDVTLSGVIVTADSAIDAASLTVPGTAAAATFNGPIDLTGTGTDFSVSALILNVNGTVDSGAGSILWNTDTISIGANVSGTGSITIEPITQSRTIGINGAGSLSLTLAEINDIQPGFTDLQIGSPTGFGAITVGTLGAVSFNDPVTILSPAGSITVNGEISATGANGVTLHAGVITLQVAGPTPAISTQAGDIDFQGGVLLGANTKLVTTGGDINQQGTINGAFDLNLNAGSGNVTINGSSSPVNASIGGAVRLTSVEVTGGTINSQPLIYTTGSQTYTASTIDLHAGGMSSSVSGSITFDGDVLLRNIIGVLTTNGNIVFNGTVDNDSAFVGSHGALNIIAPGSQLDFNGDVGDGSQLLGLTVTSAAHVVFDGDLNSAGNISLTANEVDFFGGPNSVQGTGVLTLQPVGVNVPIHIGAASTGSFNLTTGDLAALKHGFQSINIGSTAGTGGIFIDSGGATFSDPVTFRQGGGGAVTVNGPLTGLLGSTFTFAATTTILGNNITTHGGQVLFSQATLKNDVTITTNNGTIQFNGLLMDSGSGGDNLTLDAGSGLIALLGGAGKTTGPQLGDLTTDSTGTTNLFGSVYAGSLTVDAGGTLDLHAPIKTTGAQAYNEPITLTGAVTLTAHNHDITLTGATTTVDSVLGKVYGFTVKAGTGDISIDGDLGGTHALGAINLNTKGDVTLNGDATGTTFTVSAANFTVQDVTTTGRQTYTGAGTFDGALSGTLLTVTSKVDVSSTAAWDFTGTTKIKGSAIDLTSSSNIFGPLVLTGASADIHESSRILLGAISLTGDLDLTAGGDITQSSGSVRAGGFSADTTGAVLLSTVTNVIKTIDATGVTAGSAITILTGGNGLGIFGDLTATAGNIFLSADSGSSRGEITNHAGAGAISVSTGFVFDLYSYSEIATHLGSLSFTNVVSGHRYPNGAPSAISEAIYVVR